ncbi:MAG: helicase HerA-like domain-containing protein [Hyphomicrobium sp.]
MSEKPKSAAADNPAADPRFFAQNGRLLLGGSHAGIEYIELKLANRHGLVTGATGTGKTVTLQVLAESFSAAGVPVFAADIKGDLSGIGIAGEQKPGLIARAEEIGLPGYFNAAFPVAFWDIFGEQGHPVRTSVQSMGPLLLSRLLDLSEPQEGVLNIAFRWAEDRRTARDPKMVIRKLRDLRAVIEEMGRRAPELRSKYGNIAPATVGVLQRRLLVLEEQGADKFFGETSLDINDFMRLRDGYGVINILAADKLMDNPRLYATALLWMLDELFEKLPEVGDLEKPKLVFLFDEAHLLFDDAPKAVLDQIERVTRLIRSKAVGVYYVTQSPSDVPDRVSAQLGNRVQHALRAFTPKEQKAVRAAAETFVKNPEFNTEQAIQQLKVGEALVSTLRNKGEPSMVQRALIRPPMAQIGPLTREQRAALIEADSENGDKYGEESIVEGAFERIQAMNSTMGNVSEKLGDVKEKLGGWFGVGRKD